MFDVSRHPLAKDTNSAKESNHRAGDGCHDQKKHHHGNRSVLIFVIQSGAKEAVSSNGFGKTSSFLKLWRLPSRDALALSDFATHAATSRMRVIALAKEGVPQPSFTDAIISHPWSGTTLVWQVSEFTLRLKAAQVGHHSVSISRLT